MTKHGGSGMAHDHGAAADFPGFRPPFYTMVPNELFDLFLPVLTGAELKVALYITRRTFGFGKAQDGISLSQMMEGVVAKDGRHLDYGCGIKSRSTLLETLRSLVERKLVVAVRQRSDRYGNEPTVYRLNLMDSGKDDPLVPKIVPRGGAKSGHPLAPKISPRVGPKSGPPLAPKIDPTKESASKESLNRKHHHPAGAVSNNAAAGLEPKDDDAFEAPSALTPCADVEAAVESMLPPAEGMASDAEVATAAQAIESGASPVQEAAPPASCPSPAEVTVLDGVVSRMLALGLAPRLAAQKAAEYPLERIEAVLDRLPHRRAKNPAGYFLAELSSGDFAAPPALERRQRQADKAKPLQHQVAVQEAVESALNARIQAAVGQLTDAARDALTAEARRLVAQRSGRTVERVPPDSPLVLGMFETLVEQRYCRPSG